VGVGEVVLVEVAVIIGLTASNSRSLRGFLHSIHRAIGTMDSSLNIEEGLNLCHIGTVQMVEITVDV
jgi:hypothetical protein